jgi:hypothetical protein
MLLNIEDNSQVIKKNPKRIKNTNSSQQEKSSPEILLRFQKRQQQQTELFRIQLI